MFARQVDSCYGTLWVWGLEWVCKNWNLQGFTTQLHHKLHLAYYDAKSATLQWTWFLNCPPQFCHAVHTDEASLTAHQCVFGQRNILFYYFLCVVACNVLLWFAMLSLFFTFLYCFIFIQTEFLYAVVQIFRHDNEVKIQHLNEFPSSTESHLI